MRSFQLAERIVEVCEKFPDFLAVRSGNVDWLYADLMRSALEFSDRICEIGDSGTPVTVWYAKSPESIVAILGSQLAGYHLRA